MHPELSRDCLPKVQQNILPNHNGWDIVSQKNNGYTWELRNNNKAQNKDEKPIINKEEIIFLNLEEIFLLEKDISNKNYDDEEIKKEIIDELTFLVSSSISKGKNSIVNDIVDSYKFRRKYDSILSELRKPSFVTTKSNNVYKNLQDKNKLQKHFSSSTAFLIKLSFPKEIKFIASYEHYKLLTYYISAVKHSQNFEIKHLLEDLYEIAKMEDNSDRDNHTKFKKNTRSIKNIYVSNVRLWLEHYAGTLNILDYSQKTTPKLIEEVQANFYNKKGNENDKNNANLLIGSSLYGLIRIIGNTLSFLRQWHDAYSQITGENEAEFGKIIDKIEEKAEFISNDLYTNNLDNIQYAVENYATFMIYKIAIFLLKVNNCIETKVKEKGNINELNQTFFILNQRETTLEQQYRNIRLFLYHYSFILGFENEHSTYTEKNNSDIFDDFLKRFESNENLLEFLFQHNMINSYVKNDLETYINDILNKEEMISYFDSKHRPYNTQWLSDVTEKCNRYREDNIEHISFLESYFAVKKFDEPKKLNNLEEINIFLNSKKMKNSTLYNVSTQHEVEFRKRLAKVEQLKGNLSINEEKYCLKNIIGLDLSHSKEDLRESFTKWHRSFKDGFYLMDYIFDKIQEKSKFMQTSKFILSLERKNKYF